MFISHFNPQQIICPSDVELRKNSTCYKYIQILRDHGEGVPICNVLTVHISMVNTDPEYSL